MTTHRRRFLCCSLALASHGLLAADAGLPGWFVRRRDAALAKDDADELGMVAHHLRFDLRRPAEAIAFYERAAQKGSRVAALAIADTLQNELRDARGAIDAWRRLRALYIEDAAGPSHEPWTGITASWCIRWVDAQLAWLERAARFRGAVGGPDAAGFMNALLVAAGFGAVLQSAQELPQLGPQKWRPVAQVDGAAIAREIEALPTSIFALGAALDYLQYVPDAAAIAAFVERQDPAGFAAAWYFAMAATPAWAARGAFPMLQHDPSETNPFRTVARGYLRERGIRILVPDFGAR